MPAIVALVASNFARAERPRAYGLVASAGAIAVAAGPLIGGLFTTYLSWRLGVRRRGARRRSCILAAHPADGRHARPRRAPRLDLVGTALSALGLGLVVFGILRAGTLGLRPARSRTRPSGSGLSPVDLADPRRRRRARGCSCAWENRRRRTGARPLCRPGHAAEPDAAGRAHRRSSSSTCCRPACSSRCRCSCRSRSGCRRSPPASGCCRCRSRCCSPRSGIPKVFPHASPRRVVQLGFLALFAGHRRAGRRARRGRRAGDRDLADAARRPRHRRAGVAARRASPCRRCPTSRAARSAACRTRSPTSARRSAPRSPARCSISALTSSFLTGIAGQPGDVPDDVAVDRRRSSSRAASRSSPTPTSRPRSTTPASPTDTADAIVDENEAARLDGLRAALGTLAVATLLAAFAARRLPTEPPGGGRGRDGRQLAWEPCGSCSAGSWWSPGGCWASPP